MTVAQIASAIIEALTSGLSGIITAVPEAIVSAFQALFMTTTGTGESATTSLSVFGTVMLIFGGIALAFGITKLIFNVVRSKVG